MAEKKKNTLLDISDDMQALDDLLEDADLEDPQVQEQLARWSDELVSNMEEKVDGYAAFITMLLGRAEIRKKEADRLAMRAKRDATNADGLKKRLLYTLMDRGIKKLDTARFKVTVAGAGGKMPVECNVQPEDLPPEYQTVPPVQIKANLDAIREALEGGKEVDGCLLLERGKYLRIS